MGRAYLALGQLDSARAAVVEGLGIKRTVADSTGVSWGLVDLGRVQLAEGDRSDALKSLQDARSVLRLIGDRGGRRRSGRRAVAVRLGGGDSELGG